MRWRGRRQSTNVEDRRGRRTGRRTGGRPIALGGGLGMVAIVVVVMLLGGDPTQLLNSMASGPARAPAPSQQPLAPGDETGAFVKTLLADTEDVWTAIFRQAGGTYDPPRLVLYSGYTRMPGGVANAATGPFYLPANQTIYLDTSFFSEMANRFQAGGDFAYAYVVSHEVAHHVQKLLGLTDRVHSRRGRVSKREYNQLSVRLELQADFLAGVWAHHAQRRWQILEEGDIEEAMNAATAIGDDRLQKQSTGRVVPDAFTHGTSAQRVRWFTRGLRTGDINQGDTFSIPYSEL
ncbi:MAG: zinc metallopeptidase [Akkermansiaceae bacterium]|nr:zinc metallopeptidase [Akkermansiaceae bacterium]NNM31213.1 zinc metallopeptidase [Akkermansiaceae bacterium]